MSLLSKYTTELRYICEQQSGLSESSADYASIISAARPKIFSFDYPIFDSEYKPLLETKILKHYYTREISAETYGLWKMWLDTKMNEIMPYYNKLYESALIEFDPLRDADYYKDGSNTLNRNSSSSENQNTDTNYADNKKSQSDRNTTSETETDMSQLRTDNLQSQRTDDLNEHTAHTGKDSTHTEDIPKKETWDLFSDTPQGGINGIQDAEDSSSLAGNGYLTTARHVLEDATGSESDQDVTYGSSTDTDNTGTQTTNDTGTQQLDNTGTVTDTSAEHYADNADTTGNSSTRMNGQQRSNMSDLGSYAEHVFGKFPGKTYSAMLAEFRETFLNIDMMIIRDLSDLFFNLW